MTWSNVRCQVSGVAAAALPPLLVLYPLLLLLDDLEPGFVRSVVNPHWFLLALIVIGIVAGRDVGTDAPTSSPILRQAQGISRLVLVFVAAIVAGFWAWWRVGGGRIGVVVGFLTAVAIAGTVIEMVREAVERGMSKPKAQNSNEVQMFQ